MYKSIACELRLIKSLILRIISTSVMPYSRVGKATIFANESSLRCQQVVFTHALCEGGDGHVKRDW